MLIGGEIVARIVKRLHDFFSLGDHDSELLSHRIIFGDPANSVALFSPVPSQTFLQHLSMLLH
jgi:hypothetical protein